jgi:hypothetical protein
MFSLRFLTPPTLPISFHGCRRYLKIVEPWEILEEMGESECTHRFSVVDWERPFAGSLHERLSRTFLGSDFRQE